MVSWRDEGLGQSAHVAVGDHVLPGAVAAHHQLTHPVSSQWAEKGPSLPGAASLGEGEELRSPCRWSRSSSRHSVAAEPTLEPTLEGSGPHVQYLASGLGALRSG